MATRHPHTGRPKAAFSALELRVLFELAILPAALPLLMTAPRGDGHPVLLLPGFGATDVSLEPLRVFLRNRHYHVETWGLGRNVGFNRRFAQVIEQKVRYLHHRHRRKVSLVGWSLGGVYGFYTAHNAPECIRSVVSMGSPMRFSAENFKTPLLVRAVYRYFAHPMGPVAHLAHVRAKVLKSPPPVPSTCIYSMTDGVVPPTAARIETEEGQHENIWVPGSHLGLGFNAAVMWILADRLAQAEGEWQPFRIDGRLGSLYEQCAGLVARAA